MSKKIKEVYDEVVDFENLYKAYKKALKGKNRYTAEAIEFQQDETYNLYELQDSLMDYSYTFDKYTKFKVYEPKERIIHAPCFKDKIVQIALNNITTKHSYTIATEV